MKLERSAISLIELRAAAMRAMRKTRETRGGRDNHGDTAGVNLEIIEATYRQRRLAEFFRTTKRQAEARLRTLLGRPRLWRAYHVDVTEIGGLGLGGGFRVTPRTRFLLFPRNALGFDGLH